MQVMVVGGTKPSYNVEIYSGNHPFYQGGKTSAVMDEGMVSSLNGTLLWELRIDLCLLFNAAQLNKFKKRFADDDELNKVSVFWIENNLNYISFLLNGVSVS